MLSKTDHVFAVYAKPSEWFGKLMSWSIGKITDDFHSACIFAGAIEFYGCLTEVFQIQVPYPSDKGIPTWYYWNRPVGMKLDIGGLSQEELYGIASHEDLLATIEFLAVHTVTCPHCGRDYPRRAIFSHRGAYGICRDCEFGEYYQNGWLLEKVVED